MSPSHKPRVPRSARPAAERAATPAPSGEPQEQVPPEPDAVRTDRPVGSEPAPRPGRARANNADAAVPYEETAGEEAGKGASAEKTTASETPADEVVTPTVAEDSAEQGAPVPSGSGQNRRRTRGPFGRRRDPKKPSGSSKTSAPAPATPGEDVSAAGSAPRENGPEPAEQPGPRSGETAANTHAGPSNVLAFPDRARSPRGRRNMSRGRRWLLGGLALVVVLAVFLAVVFFSPLLAVRTITVQGTHLTDHAAIEQKLSSLEGKPLTRISDQEVRDAVGSDVKIRSITVEDHPPHELVVDIHERVPVATVKEGDQYVLVDNEGVAVGKVASQEDADVPLVDGGLKEVKSSSFSSVVTVLQTVPESLLSQMDHAEAKSDAGIKLRMKNGTTVVWGTDEDSEYKAQVLEAMIKALGQDTAYSTIDVSSPDRPVTK